MLDGRDFFFLELNARIQVEHPVTELVTGVDLVRAQLPFGRREGSPRRVEPRLDGHAVEVLVRRKDPGAQPCRRPAASNGSASGQHPRRRRRRGRRRDRYVVRPDDRDSIAHAPTRDAASTSLPLRLTRPRSKGDLRIFRFSAGSSRIPSSAPAARRQRCSQEHPPLSLAPARDRPRGMGARRLNIAPPARKRVDSTPARFRALSGGGKSVAIALMLGTAERSSEAGAYVKARQALVAWRRRKMETPPRPPTTQPRASQSTSVKATASPAAPSSSNSKSEIGSLPWPKPCRNSSRTSPRAPTRARPPA